jgi:hypothetical protein
MIHSVSSESITVAPSPPKLFFPRLVSGCSSSIPMAYCSYLANASRIASFTASLLA